MIFRFNNIKHSKKITAVSENYLRFNKKKKYGIRTGFPVSGGTGAADGIEITPIGVLNLNFQNSTGLDVAVVNTTSKNMRGVQLGVVNYASNQKGCQFGILNPAEWSSIQFGLINIIQNGWLHFFPFFNFSFK